jgi:hypothetical protein
MTLVISRGITLANGFTWNETVWNPNMLSTELWLDASVSSTITLNGSNVSEWRDKKGNGKAFPQATATSQPAYTANGLNSLPVLSFDGSDHLRSSTGFQPYRSTAIVYRDASTAGFVTFLGSVFNGNTGAYHGGSNASALFSSTFTDLNTRNGSNFRNGTSIGTGTTTARPTSTCIQTHVAAGDLAQALTTIGADNLPDGRKINGIIAEVVVSRAAWTTLERQKLEGYLAHKWGLTANLPSDHPYKTVGPTP